MTITKERQREVPPFLQEHYMGIRTDELEFWSGAVAKGERGHPTRTRTRVYSVPNMHSDRNAKEPGSMAWHGSQSTYSSVVTAHLHTVHYGNNILRLTSVTSAVA